jgi:hypothetical protein
MRRLAWYIERMLYSVSDVATMIGFSRSKTEEMIRTGKMAHVVIEGGIRVRCRDLLAWIGGCSRQR